MNRKLLSVILWVVSFLLMFGLSVYQRMTGPTKPLLGKTHIGNSDVRYKLIRTWGEDSGAEIRINVNNENVHGICVYKRYKSHDSWDTVSMQRNGTDLLAILPQLEPAGKMMYHITLYDEEKDILLNEQPAILRYKGLVPGFVLIPHILFMFLAMMFSIRTGFEALFIRRNTYALAVMTTLFIILGGLIFGPVVQKFAFGAYWTGWPLGTDLTDNKTAIAFLFWIIAVFVLRKNRQNRLWPIIAAVVLLAIYIIPHSLMGSEIDYMKEETHITE